MFLIKKIVKAMKSELKMDKESAVTGRKLELKSMVWTRRKKETSNQKRMKQQEFKKMRNGLGTSGTSLSVPTSNSWGARKRRGRARN